MSPPTEKWPRYWYHFRRRLFLSIAVYPVAFTIMFSLLDYGSNPGKWSWPTSIVSPAVYSFSIQFSLWLIFTVAYTIAAAYGPRSMEILGANKFFNILASILGIIPGLLAARSLVSYLTNAPSDLSLSTFLIALFTSILISLIFIFQHQYQHFRDKSLNLEKSTAEARYQTLKSQVQPHFLFNSLNSLSELIHSKPERAIEMTENLANLYRSITANSHNKTSTVKSEVEILETYLALERIRFGGRLVFTIDVPENLANLWIPSLMLQTLVENAVKHGIAPSMQGGKVFVTITNDRKSGYRAMVANTGAALTPKAFNKRNSGLGLGLANTRERLKLLYGDLNLFSLTTNSSKQTVAEFFFSGEEIP